MAKKQKLDPGYYDPNDYTLVHNRYLSELKSLESRDENARCVWTEDDEGVWGTACGERWVFTEGYPWENHARFCFACGHLISAVGYVEPPSEDAVDPAEGIVTE